MLHGILLLGITFHYVKPKPSLPTLDVTLVDVANREAPDKADFLAQANNAGGGESDKAGRPSQPFSGPLPTEANGTSQQHVDASTPAPRDATSQRLVTTTGASPHTVDTDTGQTEAADQQSADELRKQEEMARLAAEVRDKTEAYAKRPKKKFISANTKEFIYAAYMRGWIDRIERVGNLNYPNEARQKGVHGELVLTVALNHDGTVKSIDVIKSSGQPLLDESAKRIVRLAAPFPTLPSDKERVDELYITRTWLFQPDDVLKTR
ncbi:MAG TPA: energy transducer TonB [Dyella sp.]